MKVREVLDRLHREGWIQARQRGRSAAAIASLSTPIFLGDELQYRASRAWTFQKER